MSSGVKQSFILLAVLSYVFTPASVQIAMPMYMPAAVPQPMYAVPAPVAMLVAVQSPERKTTTTTTTSKPHYAVAVPVPMPVPMPLQFAVPAQPPPMFCQSKPREKACPPCPPCVCLPSCTPAFFSYCSPCHQKCRCRTPEDAPVPLPVNPSVPVPAPVYPVPILPAAVGPPPVVVVPVPPIIRRPEVILSSDSDSSDSCDSDSDRYYLRRGRKLRKTNKFRIRNYRRNENEQNTDLVEPVLSYVSENGDVKFKTKLSNIDAMKILSKGMIISSNEKDTGNTKSDIDSVVVTKGRRKSGRKYNKVLLRDTSTNHELKQEKQKFMFKPPANKKIKKVAVSFQVT